MIISPDIYRAARGLLGLTQRDVGLAARVDRRVLIRLENCENGHAPKEVNLVRFFYEKEGVMFLQADDGGGEGVRWEVLPRSFDYRSQLRAARFLLGWSQDELANRTDIKRLAITRYENEGTRCQSEIYIKQMFVTFTEAGLKILNGGKYGTGVRWLRQEQRIQNSQPLNSAAQSIGVTDHPISKLILNAAQAANL